MKSLIGYPQEWKIPILICAQTIRNDSFGVNRKFSSQGWQETFPMSSCTKYMIAAIKNQAFTKILQQVTKSAFEHSCSCEAANKVHLLCSVKRERWRFEFGVSPSLFGQFQPPFPHSPPPHNVRKNLKKVQFCDVDLVSLNIIINNFWKNSNKVALKEPGEQRQNFKKTIDFSIWYRTMGIAESRL